MHTTLEIKPGIGLCSLLFGATMTESEAVFGKPEEIQLIDDIEEFKTTVWHYWDNGFTLFFDEQNHQRFHCVEIDNDQTLLWGKTLFELKEKQIIELFKANNITQFESEQHEWGEKRLSFDQAHIDFYFERNKLVSINFCKPIIDSELLILKN